MLVRVTGGMGGIAEYLVNGQKQDRDMARDEMDERVVLAGDLDVTDTIIKGMDKEGEKYLHITMAFKEDSIDREVLKNITQDFKEFAMSAYAADEFNMYAEAHIPKTKSYINQQTGELVERKPHIHIVIPEQNLLSGQNLNPLGRVDQQTKFLEAFQESINEKYGLASPKDNRRTEFTDESEIVSRYKGDMFAAAGKDLKEIILSDMLDRKVNDYDQFKEILNHYGAAKARNAGKETEYQNVKLVGQDKGVNLKDYVFSREFIEKSQIEKQQFLAEQGRNQYAEAKDSKRAANPAYAERLKEWHEVRAAEIKYINSGNRTLYAEYKSAEVEDKKIILAARADTFYAKHRKEHDHDHDRTDQRASAEFRARESDPTVHHPERLVAAVADNLRAASEHLQAARRTDGELEQAARNLADRRLEGAFAALGRRPDRDSGDPEKVAPTPTPTPATAQPRDVRPADSVAGQLVADLRERKTDAQAGQLAEFAQIKRELDARRLLDHLSQTHGVIPEKYEVTKAKDGSDRIKTGSRHLNVSDFLTQEMRLSFAEAAPILRTVHAAQHGREVTQAKAEPSRDLWKSFRDTLPQQAKVRTQEWSAQRLSERERRAAIRDTYRAARQRLKADRHGTPSTRKGATSVARMERVTQDMNLRDAVSQERQQLQDKHRQPPQIRYRAYLTAQANAGNETALAELRRQRDTHPPPGGPNGIEGKEAERHGKSRSAPFAPLAYSVDEAGTVTYYADPQKRRAVLIDSGPRVTVTAPVEDRQVVEAALRLAVDKFGPRVRIEGTAAFKKQMLDVAVKTGDLRIEFTDQAMNQELTERRAERADLQALGRAAVAADREAERVRSAPPPPPAPKPERELERERSRGMERW